MSSQGGFGLDMAVSGLIACVIAVACVFVISLLVPFPWGLVQAMVAAGIAAFSGAAVSFVRGFKSGQKPAEPAVG